MKLLLVALISGVLVGGPFIRAAEDFAPEKIAALMQRANTYQIAHPFEPGDSRNWIRGTWMTGVMAAFKATKDPAYYRQARAWAEAGGFQPGVEPSGANVLTSVQTYLDLYFIDREARMLEPAIKWLDSGRPNTPTGNTVWYMEAKRRYADSLYVAAPALAALGQATGDERYGRWLHAFFWDLHRELYDPETALFFRDGRFREMKSANGRKVLWSRGNGWVLGTFPRLLPYLPFADPHRERYVALFRAMAESIAKRQTASGLWTTNLDDAAEFPAGETSGSAFFCYGLAWGVRSGILDQDRFTPVVRRAWTALVANVSSEGKVRWGQTVGDRPVAVSEENTQEYVTGTLLLAGSEVYQLAQFGLH
jgi:unsaturated rhamnogalacturonyl hydrolase